MHEMDVALATCAHKPEPDPDELPLLSALRASGLDARTLAWDDPSADWSAPRIAVLRSTWNYAQAPQVFADWIDRAERSTELYNRPAVARANLHKRYLLDLADRGVPVVPTALVPRDAKTPLRSIATTRGWDRVVVKPAISAASYMTARFDAAELGAGDPHLRAILSTGDALVQPYLPSVEGEGERALVWIDGAFTHSVRKSARFSGQTENVDGQRALTPEEQALGTAALNTVTGELLYARVDVARGADGALAVMELELLEPSLFLLQWPDAMARLVNAIAARARLAR